MNFIISTTYQNNTYSLLVKGLELAEIQNIFVASAFSQYQDDQGFHGDLIAQCEFSGKSFQIISNIPKLKDLFNYLNTISLHNPSLAIITLNSISQPLDEDASKQLVTKLIEKSQLQRNSITPKVISLIESMKKDVNEFIIRFTGYITDEDKDILVTRLHDLYAYMEQGNISDIRSTMSHIIEKMEFLESDYIKSINSDNDQPLEQFNHELNSIINQNRLFRNHSLNQLSGGSSLDYYLFKLRSYIRLGIDSIGGGFVNFEKVCIFILSFLSKVGRIAAIIYFSFGFLFLELGSGVIELQYIKFGIFGLCFMMIYRFRNARWFIGLPLCIFICISAYLSYLTITVNFGL